MAFDARKALSTLDWSFEPYHKYKGIVPEPTDDELRQMNKQLASAMETVTGSEGFDPDDRAAMLRAFNNLTEDEVRQMQDAQLDAICVVTKNSPSRDVLVEVGPRLRNSFAAWLMGELNGQGN